MRQGLDWYKREPLAYLGSVQGICAKHHAVFSVVLDLIYLHGGSINHDAAWISGWISDMGSAAVRRAIADLADMGLLEIAGDQITEKRARNEAKTKQNRRENAAFSGRIGGVSSGESRRRANENKTLTEANASSKTQAEKRREEKKEKEEEKDAPDGARVLALFTADETPAIDERPDQFERFWKAYPEKKGKPAARKAFDKAAKACDPEQIITGAERYAVRLQNVQPGQFVPHPKYPQGWLSERRWEDEPAPEAKAARRYFGEIVR